MENHQLINASSGNQEYFTPIHILDAVKETMGGIDLDPASSEQANLRIKASLIHTKEDDGLKHHWFGRVFMNHPFGKPENPCPVNCEKPICKTRGFHITERLPGNEDWINHLMTEWQAKRVEEACCLTYACTSEKWFLPLLRLPQIYLVPRTNFILPDGKVKKGVTKGSVVTYLGANYGRFFHYFRHLGVGKI